MSGCHPNTKTVVVTRRRFGADHEFRHVKGIDLDIDLTRSVASARVLSGANVAYLMDFERKGAVNSPSFELVNTAYNPLRLRGRAYVGLQSGRWDATAFINYANRYKGEFASGSTRIKSWTTVDANLSYSFGSESAFRKAVLSIDVGNVFDKSPPFYEDINDTGFSVNGYDTANADIFGRTAQLTIRKSL